MKRRWLLLVTVLIWPQPVAFALSNRQYTPGPLERNEPVMTSPAFVIGL
jgi:hypothetical protein